MQVRSRNNQVEFLCDQCGTTEVVKEGLSATGFIRKFRAFQRVHDWKCIREAKEVSIVGVALKETDSLFKRLTSQT
ncbi:MAG: hypothetical protein K2X63_10310 [Burkholderiaceae bacterium]|nr:hypothetical protein [Burkholderiaceae bacterium]